MDICNAWFQASRRTARALYLPTLLSLLWVTSAVAQDWTFDWQALGWTPGSTGPRTYTNVAGSGIDVRVTITLTNGSWLSGYPALDGEPGQGDELNLRVDFNSGGNNDDRNALVSIEFFQTGTTTPAPVAMKGIAVRDVDRQQGVTWFCGTFLSNSYQDVVRLTAQPGPTNPNFIGRFVATPNWTASGGNTVSGNGSAGIAPDNQAGWASFNFATTTIRSMALRYSKGDGGGCTDSTQQHLWISDFVFSDTPVITQAVISAFGVQGDGTVEWETASEVGTAGFNLLRLDEASGTFVQINDRLLPALIGAPQGGLYRYLDRAVAPGGTYSYRLEEIEANGTARGYGPFTVTAGSGPPSARAVAAQPLADAQSLVAARTIADANGYERTARVPTGRRASMIEGLDVSSRSARPAVMATQAATLKTAARILVDPDGLYALSADDIAAALDVSFQKAQTWIKKGKLRLRQGGKPVAWRADPGGDRLYFYGEAVKGVDAIYTRYNTYWLDRGNGLAMTSLDGAAPAPAAVAEPFQSSIHAEENSLPAPFLASDPDADFWYWSYVLAGDGRLGAPQLTVPAPGAAATGTATLRAYLQGATDLAPGYDHHARLLVNDVEVGDATWDGIAPYVLSATFDADLLADGDNRVTVAGELDPGVTYSVFWVDGFDLDYPRIYRAADDQLRLSGAGNPVVTVDGFSGSDIAVLDIDDPRNPRWLMATRVSLGDSGYAVSFVPATPTTDYVAAVAMAPVSVQGAARSTLKTQTSGAEYLVIAPSSLRAGADALAAYRGGKVVELQEIYDAFNDGIANPNAIRSFLSRAYRQWQPRPRYVALVGKGTFDPKDYQGYGTNRFPVLMAATPHDLFASDNRYADIRKDDGIPDLAVGRIPALSDADLQSYVDKLHSYEVGALSSTALLVADDGDDFAVDSGDVELALQTNGFDTVPIYFQPEMSVSETRLQVIDAMNAGVGLFNYVGHGGVTQLADEGLLRSVDVAQLTNGARLPVFLAFSCAVGNGSYPGFDSLAETLLWRQGGGAVAALASAGMSDNTQAHLLNMSAVKALSDPGASPILGDAAAAALSDFAGQGGQRYMRDIYPLLGDPALRVRP